MSCISDVIFVMGGHSDQNYNHYAFTYRNWSITNKTIFFWMSHENDYEYFGNRLFIRSTAVFSRGFDGQAC